MKKNLANIVTGSRILFSICLLVTPVFSLPFYIVYLLCGFTDMIDGTIARITKSATPFGAKLDSAADLIFLAVSSIRLFPAIFIPFRLWMWVLIIAILRIARLIRNAILKKQFLPEHTVMNKLTGLLLFLLPLTLPFMEPAFSIRAVCVVASLAAFLEWIIPEKS